MVSEKIIQKLNQISDYSDIGCLCTKDQQSGVDPSMCSMCVAGGLINTICSDIENAYREVFPIEELNNN